MTLPVGLLFDHTHSNFGDQAIGLALEQILLKHRLPYRVIPNRGGARPELYASVVVGGGHCLRAPGDSFYDQFRLAGRHVLNTMGVSPDCGDLGHLKDYRYISVRSRGDLAYVQPYRPDAVVAPCISLALDAAGAAGVPKVERAILVNMNWYTRNAVPDWLETVRSAFPHLETVLVSITPYNKDKEYLSEVAAAHGLRLVSGLGPAELAAFIGQEGVHGVLTSSLHATLFAYRSGKPFLVQPYSEKITFFLEDRGLLSWAWGPALDAKALRDRLKPGPDQGHAYRDSWLRDQAALRAHIDRMIRACEDACSGR